MLWIQDVIAGLGVLVFMICSFALAGIAGSAFT